MSISSPILNFVWPAADAINQKKKEYAIPPDDICGFLSFGHGPSPQAQDQLFFFQDEHIAINAILTPSALKDLPNHFLGHPYTLERVYCKVNQLRLRWGYLGKRIGFHLEINKIAICPPPVGMGIIPRFTLDQVFPSPAVLLRKFGFTSHKALDLSFCELPWQFPGSPESVGQGPSVPAPASTLSQNSQESSSSGQWDQTLFGQEPVLTNTEKSDQGDSKQDQEESRTPHGNQILEETFTKKGDERGDDNVTDQDSDDGENDIVVVDDDDDDNKSTDGEVFLDILGEVDKIKRTMKELKGETQEYEKSIRSDLVSMVERGIASINAQSKDLFDKLKKEAKEHTSKLLTSKVNRLTTKVVQAVMEGLGKDIAKGADLVLKLSEKVAKIDNHVVNGQTLNTASKAVMENIAKDISKLDARTVKLEETALTSVKTQVIVDEKIGKDLTEAAERVSALDARTAKLEADMMNQQKSNWQSPKKLLLQKVDKHAEQLLQDRFAKLSDDKGLETLKAQVALLGQELGEVKRESSKLKRANSTLQLENHQLLARIRQLECNILVDAEPPTEQANVDSVSGSDEEEEEEEEECTTTSQKRGQREKLAKVIATRARRKRSTPGSSGQKRRKRDFLYESTSRKKGPMADVTTFYTQNMMEDLV